jgi:GDPmannose 4,6-dehydratase
MKSALITGISGQDGTLLTDFLVKKNYKVSGIVRDLNSTKSISFMKRFPDVHIIEFSDTSLVESINQNSPCEIYNLAATSSVATSFEKPFETSLINGLGALSLFETIRKLGAQKSIRVYQAGSSEMFGAQKDSPQSESSSFHPSSPYGTAKVFAHQSAVQYRQNYGLYIANGILFNHESEFRDLDFVTRKITSNIARIKLGSKERFTLGNLASRRDWGYAGDYVRAMWKMLQVGEPDDYVIATGVTRSVEEFLLTALRIVGLDQSIERYVLIDTKLSRPADPYTLVGNSQKAQQILDWKPEVSFESMIALMVENDLQIQTESGFSN